MAKVPCSFDCSYWRVTYRWGIWVIISVASIGIEDIRSLIYLTFIWAARSPIRLACCKLLRKTNVHRYILKDRSSWSTETIWMFGETYSHLGEQQRHTQMWPSEILNKYKVLILLYLLNYTLCVYISRMFLFL